MTNIKITLATESDTQMLKIISMEAFKGDFEKYGSYPPGIDSVDYHLAQIGSGDYYKIEYNGVTVGGINLTPKSEEHIEIEYFFIHPDYQNKKIGATVLKWIEEKYASISIWSLCTPQKEFRNHYFYEKLGYKKIGEFSPVPNNEFKMFKYEKIGIMNRLANGEEENMAG